MCSKEKFKQKNETVIENSWKPNQQESCSEIIDEFIYSTTRIKKEALGIYKVDKIQPVVSYV